MENNQDNRTPGRNGNAGGDNKNNNNQNSNNNDDEYQCCYVTYKSTSYSYWWRFNGINCKTKSTTF